jgi:cobalt transporter subunit CbtB
MKTENVTSHDHQNQSIFSSLWFQGGVALLMVGILLYTVFFSTYPAVHDFFHDFRHSMLIIPCH